MESLAAVALRAALLRDLVEGFRFALIKQQRILLLILAASLYTFGTAAFSTLLPVFARKLLDLGPAEVGYLWSAFGAGLLEAWLRTGRTRRLERPHDPRRIRGREGSAIRFRACRRHERRRRQIA